MGILPAFQKFTMLPTLTFIVSFFKQHKSTMHRRCFATFKAARSAMKLNQDKLMMDAKVVSVSVVQHTLSTNGYCIQVGLTELLNQKHPITMRGKFGHVPVKYKIEQVPSAFASHVTRTETIIIPGETFDTVYVLSLVEESRLYNFYV